jgi:hypothetical protein
MPTIKSSRLNIFMLIHSFENERGLKGVGSLEDRVVQLVQNVTSLLLKLHNKQKRRVCREKVSPGWGDAAARIQLCLWLG